jgi:uncharacterized protein
MSKSIRTITTFCFLICLNCIFAQSQQELVFTTSIAQPVNKPKVYSTFKEQINKNSNELELLVSALFFLYKELLSSQDSNKCAFHPSCSLYSILAIKEEGVLKGGIMTFDRLTRCNGLSPEKYKIDLKKKVLVDPIKW